MVDPAAGEVEPPGIVSVGPHHLNKPRILPRAAEVLVEPVHGRLRAVAARRIGPGDARREDVENPGEEPAEVGSPAAVRGPDRKDRTEFLPEPIVGLPEWHAPEYAPDKKRVSAA
jgi:hypothetical protein